jgi:hypothetical protein
VKISLTSKKIMHVLDIVLHIPGTFSVSASLRFPSTAHAFSPERLYNNFQHLRHTFSDICTKFDAVLLSDPSRGFIMPDTVLHVN